MASSPRSCRYFTNTDLNALYLLGIAGRSPQAEEVSVVSGQA
jgi:hypothetical protein